MKCLLTLLPSLAASTLCVGETLPALRCWWAPSTQKVFLDTPAGPDARDGISLSAARDEYEAFQLVLNAEQELKQVYVGVGPFCDETGAVAKVAAQVFRVAYVSVPHTPEKQWPDPLPPLQEPVTLAPQTNHVFWVKLHVSRYQPPGQLRACASVMVDGQEAVRIPLTLKVHPFTLPQTPAARTSFGIWAGYVNPHHPEATTPEAQADLYARYYEMLLDHQISAYEVPYGLQDPRGLAYLRDPRVTSYVIPFTDNPQELRRTWEHLVAAGVADKGFYYPIDEPFTRESYDILQQRSTLIHEATGQGKVCAPFYRGPEFDPERDIFDYAADWLDVWCINTGYYGPRQRERMEERRAAGDELWWYVCCGPREPYANFFVNMPAMRHRILFWQMYQYDIRGLLYWATTYWNPSMTADPWEDMATVKDLDPKLYGDGSLLYPGSKVGICGPVSSVRMECILDGMEDLAYLRLLEQVRGREAAEAMVARLVTSLTEYSLDGNELARVREEIAAAITGQ